MASLSHAQSQWCKLIRPTNKKREHPSLIEALFWIAVGFTIDAAAALFMGVVDSTKPKSRKTKMKDDEHTGFFESVAGAAVLTFGLIRWSVEALGAIITNRPLPMFEEQYQFQRRDWIGL